MTTTAYATEAAWQADVVATAQRFGWLCWHHLRSIGTAPGLPDLELIHPRRGVHIRAELKTDNHSRSHLSPAQVVTLDAFALAGWGNGGIILAVWRPADRDAVDDILKPSPRRRAELAGGFPGHWWLGSDRRVREIRCLTDTEHSKLITLGAAAGLVYTRRDPTFAVRVA